MKTIKRTRISDLLKSKEAGVEVNVKGWVRTRRSSKQVAFVALNDGSTINNVQVVIDADKFDEELVKQFTTGACLSVNGMLVESIGGGQSVEIQATEIELLGACDSTYPLQKKGQTMEYMRTVAHLRPRTNTFGAVFRIRHNMAYAIHKFFHDKGFYYFHTPIITASDCEGAGQMFQVTTMNLYDLKKDDEGSIKYDSDFFGKQASLTVSGQLEGELAATALGAIYTFGPTFRTENSNTKTHANEFWMIEPEMAFCDLQGLMDIEEEMLKYVIKYVLDNASEEIDFCDNFVEKGLRKKITDLLESKFTRITHHDVIDILLQSNQKWEFKPSYDEDIAKEHEKYITEHFNGPVFITDWPKDIKAYYMKVNPDNKTVAAVDLVVPQAGELMGGSQREENLEVLLKRMEEMHVEADAIDWYLDTRRYGGCIHSGFGMGFERLIMYLTGVDNIRDVIPYPRTPKNCEF